MSQATTILPTAGVVSGLTFATTANGAFDALRTMFQGASAPAADAPEQGQLWLDTSVSPNICKQYDGTNWVIRGWIDNTNHNFIPLIGGGAATIASATTTSLGTAANPQGVITISGVTTITSFGSSALVGQLFFVYFSGALTLTHNATSLILPFGANILTVAGDCMVVRYEGSSNWRVMNYQFSTTASFKSALGLSNAISSTGNATFAGGFYLTPFNASTISSSTFTPDAVNGNYQYYSNGGAHRIAPPAQDSAIDVLVTNSSLAGAITFSSLFLVSTANAIAMTTTSGSKWIVSIRRINSVPTYNVTALQ